MKHSTSLLTALPAFLSLAVVSSARKCTNLTIEVTVDSRNAVFNLEAMTNDIEVVNFVLNSTQQGHNFTNEVLSGVSKAVHY